MKKMDYTIGFQAGRLGRSWTATALTDRAKQRTPEAVTFADRTEALTFLKASHRNTAVNERRFLHRLSCLRWAVPFARQPRA
jgi:hypothetical protein